MIDSILHPELEIFLTAEQIAERVQAMGQQIGRDYAARPLLLVGVLKGAAIFLADLARNIPIDCTIDFISVASYGERHRSSGDVRLLKDVSESIQGKHVLLVEDVLDTGQTMEFLKNLLLAKQPATLKVATLLDKPSRRQRPIEAEYVGFTIPERFVVGYGMDEAESFRNLPDIYCMPCVIEME